jgi:anti-sigma factor ChrR (cupin superfamily)
MADEIRIDRLLAGEWRNLTFEPFHPGIEIHRIYGDGTGSAAAVLRYEPGASTPYHEHVGFEHILVLDGQQEDEAGCYGAGSFVVNPPGTRHKVASASGCVALLIWERSVRIIT